MRKLAWWLLGVGLALTSLRIVDLFVVTPPRGYSPSETIQFDLPPISEVVLELHVLGFPFLYGGSMLLAATVIADAITKAQGTREGP